MGLLVQAHGPFPGDHLDFDEMAPGSSMSDWVAMCALSLAAPLFVWEDGEPVLEAPVRFNRDVRPLLADRCFPCHGPDKEERKGRLRLDRADGEEGAYRERYGGHAIIPGSLEDSELWYRITADDPDDRMPPPESPKPPLTPEERELIRRWIEQGANYEDHWSFVAPVAPAVPEVTAVPGSDGETWARGPVDGFVLLRLEQEGLQPQPRADERSLIRRVTLDLTGLPPTRAEIAAFLGDSAADPEGAYVRLVDRLLARPQYGEHMARYWLDLVRFADTNGIHHDHYREMSPYRDWVIRAFNDNLPFDRFATDQLAGDLNPEPTEDQLIASGFHRLHRIIDAGTALPEESLARNVLDRVEAVGTVFLGLTVQCATCHDHKYDPFTQRDFYQLSAFLNNLDAEPGDGVGRVGQAARAPAALHQPPDSRAGVRARAAGAQGRGGARERRRAEGGVGLGGR